MQNFVWDATESLEMPTTFIPKAAKSPPNISTGGVSVGDYDIIKEVLQQWGDINFWKVAMKPGKPQAYGQLRKALFFGLPGNPVSGLTVFLTIVRPALIRLMGAADEKPQTLTMKFRGNINKNITG